MQLTQNTERQCVSTECPPEVLRDTKHATPVVQDIVLKSLGLLSDTKALGLGGGSAWGLRRAAPSAEFSVDRTRHLMSFLTMLGPSPDWNVGLSAEDLCTKECGWVQKLVQDMIPWDAGTDSGVTYESPNKPTLPQEKIRPLTSLDHPQSPFYDPEGGAITPVARVVVERIARKGEQCNIVPDNVDDIVADIAQEEKEE
ncbi:spondin-1-like, partial [Clarias magur]